MRWYASASGNRRPGRLMFVSLAAAVFAAVSGCGDAAGVSGITAPGAEPRLVSVKSSPGLLECPASGTSSATTMIGPLGGILSLDGMNLAVPPLAVLTPTAVRMTIPASNYMKVRVTAGGHEHFQFRKPVALTLSYARCTRSDIDKLALTVWHIDPETNALLEHMNGTDDKAARTVSFTTDHFSGYSIGYGAPPPPDGGN